jgi:hypothetical protein
VGQSYYNTRSIEKSSAFYKMPYQDRLRGYERDKQQLLATAASLPADEFSDRLKALQDKWKI